MFTLIITLGIIAAVLITLVVLIQNPKGGGLASNFSAGNQLFGAKQTTEGVEKLTWGLAAIILIVSLSASAYNGSKSAASGSSDSEINQIMEKTPKAPKPTGATQ